MSLTRKPETDEMLDEMDDLQAEEELNFDNSSDINTYFDRLETELSAPDDDFDFDSEDLDDMDVDDLIRVSSGWRGGNNDSGPAPLFI